MWPPLKNITEMKQSEILELAAKHPQIIIQVTGADLLSFAETIVEKTLLIHRAELEARERAEKEEKMLTAQEAGEMLGVCERTLSRWRRAGYIEGVRVGGVIKYRRSDCRNILNGKANEKAS